MRGGEWRIVLSLVCGSAVKVTGVPHSRLLVEGGEGFVDEGVYFLAAIGVGQFFGP